MLSLNHKTLIGGLAALFFFPILGLSVDAQAFCVYNKLSNKKYTIEAIQKDFLGKHKRGYFKKKIKQGKSECCNYKKCVNNNETNVDKRTTMLVIEVKGGKLPNQGSWPTRGACGITAGGWVDVYDDKMICYSTDKNGKEFKRNTCTIKPPGDWIEYAKKSKGVGKYWECIRIPEENATPSRTSTLKNIKGGYILQCQEKNLKIVTRSYIDQPRAGRNIPARFYGKNVCTTPYPGQEKLCYSSNYPSFGELREYCYLHSAKELKCFKTGFCN